MFKVRLNANGCYIIAAIRVLLSSPAIMTILSHEKYKTCLRKAGHCVIEALYTIAVGVKNGDQNIRVDEILANSMKTVFNVPEGSQQCAMDYIENLLLEFNKCLAGNHVGPGLQFEPVYCSFLVPPNPKKVNNLYTYYTYHCVTKLTNFSRSVIGIRAPETADYAK